MKTIKLLSIPVFVTLGFTLCRAQPLITCDDAIGIALKNNFDIVVARNNADIAKVNNSIGNAGMLPSVAVTGSDNFSVNNDDQKSANGPEQRTNKAHANSFSATAVLNWTLFDGGKMFVIKRKLNELDLLSNLEYKDKVLQTIYDVTVAYYDVVRQKQQLSSYNDVIAYNQERVTILQTSFNAGLIPKSPLLQAQIDLNVNRESAIRQQTVITEAKRTLNLLLCLDANTAFNIADSIPLSFTPDKKVILEKIYSGNISIQALQKQVAIARLSLQEAKTLGLPKISLIGGYTITQSDNTAGNVLMHRANGPEIGAAITIPLYQSGNVKRQTSIAKLQLKSSESQLENLKVQMSSLVENILDDFKNQQQLHAIEKNNIILAKENLEISAQRLKQGQTTALELKIAEESYEDALTRFINIEYSLKVSETKLKQLLALP